MRERGREGSIGKEYGKSTLYIVWKYSYETQWSIPIKEKGNYKRDMLPLFSSNNDLHFVFEPIRYLN